MTASPFVHMACSLTLRPLRDWQPSNAETAEPRLTRTERIRRLLKERNGPVTAAEITWDMAEHFPNFGSHLVWLLLKYDIAKGRVLFAADKYSWNHAYETAEAQAIRDAVKLLKRSGYHVEKDARQ